MPPIKNTEKQHFTHKPFIYCVEKFYTFNFYSTLFKQIHNKKSPAVGQLRGLTKIEKLKRKTTNLTFVRITISSR